MASVSHEVDPAHSAPDVGITPDQDLIFAKNDCDAIEAPILARRVDSGRYLLHLMRAYTDAELIPALIEYCMDVETLARTRGTLLSAAMTMLHEANRTIDRLRAARVA